MLTLNYLYRFLHAQFLTSKDLPISYVFSHSQLHVLRGGSRAAATSPPLPPPLVLGFHILIFFYISNLVAKALGLNLGKTLSNLLSNHEVLN